MIFRSDLFLVAVSTLMLTTPAAMAGEADVIAANVVQSPTGTYRFDVTVRHDDSGWDHYADAFEILSPEGDILGTRTLLHPHENEQPFTRSIQGVVIPAAITEVRIRAHDSVHEFGGQELTISLPR